MTHPPMPRLVASFAAIYLVWGSTFLAIRWAVETIPPFPMMAIRCLAGGGILLAGWLRRERAGRRPSARQWGGASLVGLFLFVGCHGLLAREEQYVPSGVSALCLGYISLLVPLLAWLLTNSGRPTTRTMVALVAAFGGVALLVGAQGAAQGSLSASDAGALRVSG